MPVLKKKQKNTFTVLDNQMFESGLSFKAIGLLAFMLKLPDEWNFTERGLASISPSDGRDSIRSAISELEEKGFLSRKPVRDERGKITNWDWTFADYPLFLEETHPGSENPTLAHPGSENPTLDNPTLENPALENPTAYKINNNKINNNKIKKDKTNKTDSDFVSYLSCQETDETTVVTGASQGETAVQTEEPEKKMAEEATLDTASEQAPMDRMEKMLRYKEIILEKLDYSYLCSAHPYDTDIIDELIELMVEVMIMPDDGSLRINGENWPVTLVKSRFMKLRFDHIEYILECLKNNTSKVRNIRSYLLTTLYNAPSTCTSYYVAEVNHDMAHPIAIKQQTPKSISQSLPPNWEEEAAKIVARALEEDDDSA